MSGALALHPVNKVDTPGKTAFLIRSESVTVGAEVNVVWNWRTYFKSAILLGSH